MALPGERYKLAFPPGLLAKIYQRRREGSAQPPENLLSNPNTVLEQEGGYVSSQNLKRLRVFPDTDLDDNWWIPSGQAFYHEDNVDPLTELTYAKEHFFLVRRYRDPFGNSSTVTFDGYDLLMIKTRDPVNNTISAKNDYRILQPKLLTDPNGNQTEVAFDALGMVVGTAIMGKPESVAHGEIRSTALKQIWMKKEDMLKGLQLVLKFVKKRLDNSKLLLLNSNDPNVTPATTWFIEPSIAETVSDTLLAT